MSDPDGEIDRLYGLPLDEFTKERDEVAKRLRKDGDRAAADEVKRQRRPTVAAWALNQLKRTEPRAVAGLIAAGERLRNAQERLLESGEQGDLRKAAADERKLTEQLAGAAEAQLTGGGHPTSAAVQSKVWATLRAIATDPEARQLFEAGRLIRDYEVSDLGLGEALALTPAAVAGKPATRTPPTRAPSARTKPSARKPPAEPAPPKPRPSPAALRRVQHTRDRLERARSDHREREQQLAAANKQLHAARREADRTAKALERARADADKARDRSDTAAVRVTELETALREAEAEITR